MRLFSDNAKTNWKMDPAVINIKNKIKITEKEMLNSNKASIAIKYDNWQKNVEIIAYSLPDCRSLYASHANGLVAAQ